MITELIGKVFATRNAVHIEHWQTLNQARHEATGKFYDEVIEALDAVVEAHIAQFGELESADLKADEIKNIDEHLREEADWIETNRDAISNESSSIGNLIDALVEVYLRLLFQLRLK